MEKPTIKTVEKMARELNPLVNQVIVATAAAQILRGQCDKIQAQLLRDDVYLDKYDGSQIFAPSLAWKMTDAGAAKYYPRLDLAYREAGYTIQSEGYCPALMAEDTKRHLEQLLIEESGKYLNVKYSDLMRSSNSIVNIKKWLDLTMRMVISHSGYKPPQVSA